MPAQTSTLGVRFPLRYGVLLVLVCAIGVFVFINRKEDTPPKAEGPQPVRVARAELKDVPEYYQGLGTVTPLHTILIKSRVDGQLMAVHFTEGQTVEAGALLAEIDPAPYKVQVMQAEASLTRDNSLLENARKDLSRYKKLVRDEAVAAQQVQSQEALVKQYEAAVLMGQASLAQAQLQLSYCRITAPVPGRVGLRLIDPGNMIRASDQTGLVVITQMQPVQVVFTLVEKQVPAVLAAMRNASAPLAVEAWDQEERTLLATGTLLTVDSQIDTTTGTIKAKALFENADGTLFPNQFVAARLRLRVLKGVLTIPSAALQRRTEGFFVYTVNASKRVSPQGVVPGYTVGQTTVLQEGLAPGDTVVIDGVDRLRDGAEVSLPADKDPVK